MTDRNNGKVRYDLIMPECEALLAQALTHGLGNYPEYGWKEVENFNQVFYSKVRRHMEAWRMGESIDEDSGLPHLALAFADLHFLLWKEIDELGSIGWEPDDTLIQKFQEGLIPREQLFTVLSPEEDIICTSKPSKD